MKIAGWILLAIGGGILAIADPMIGAGVAFVFLGGTLLSLS